MLGGTRRLKNMKRHMQDAIKSSDSELGIINIVSHRSASHRSASHRSASHLNGSNRNNNHHIRELPTVSDRMSKERVISCVQ